MHWLSQIDLSVVLTFSLVLARVSGLFVTAPIIGGQDVPPQARALIVGCIALLITPSQVGSPASPPETLPMYAIAIAGELLIGLTLGVGLQIFFSGIQMAGEVIGRIGGLMLADVFDPAMGTSVPLFSRFLHLVAMAVFVTIGGHRMAMAGLLDTFETLPLGDARISGEASRAMIDLAATSFELGFRISAPAVTALLLATIVLSIIGRTLPQLNIMALGFGLNAVLTFALMFLGLGAMTWVFQDALTPSLEHLFAALHAPLRMEWME